MASTIWAQASPTGVTGYNTTSETSTTYGLYFTVARAGVCQALWFYSPSGSATLPAAVALYAYTGQTLLSFNVSPVWSGAAGSGWVRASLPAVTLSAGTGYVVAYYAGGGGLSQGFIYTGSSPAAWFPSTSADGNITAPQATPASNNAPYQSGGGLTFPTTYNGNSLNWLLDVEVNFVSFDAVGPSASGALNNASPLTWSHTCGAGATVLLVGATVDIASGTWPATATYNGVAMTSLGMLGTDNANFGYLQVWALENPPTGSAFTVSVAVTGSGTLVGINGGSISFTGSAQLSAIQSAFGNSATASLSFTPTVAGNMVAAFCGCGSPLTATGSFTSRYNDIGTNGSGAGNVAGSTSASAGSAVTPSWTSSGDFWAVIAVEVQAATAVPAPAPLPAPALQPPGRMSPMAFPAYRPPAPAPAPAAVTTQAAAAMDGEGALTATPALASAVSLSGSGTLTAAQAFAGGAALSGTGSLAAGPQFAALAALSGAGALSTVAALAGVAALSGSGALSAASALPGAASLAGTGALSAGGQLAGAVSLSGSGTLSLGVGLAAGLSGSGTLSVAGALASPAVMSGSGSLAAGGAFAGGAALSGAGALSAGPQLSASTALSGSGTLSAVVQLAASAALSGSGSLGLRVGLAVSLSGSGTLTATYGGFIGTAALSGSGALSAGAVLPGAAALSGSGSLQAAGQRAASATLSGSGALSAAGRYGAPAALSGSGTLTAAAQFAAAAALSGSGTFSGQAQLPASAALAGSGTLAVAGLSGVALTGSGALSVTGWLAAAAALSGSGALSAPWVADAAAALSGLGALLAAYAQAYAAAAALSGSGSLSARGGLLAGVLGTCLAADWLACSALAASRLAYSVTPADKPAYSAGADD